MSGRARLPGGEPRKPNQRNSRRGVPNAVRLTPAWRAGDQVRSQGHTGVFRRSLDDDEHAEVASAGRVYRVRIADLH